MECQYCGNDKLFYRTGRIEHTIKTYYHSDKSFVEDGSNAERFSEIVPRESKYYYCASCEKRAEPAVNEVDSVLRQFGG